MSIEAMSIGLERREADHPGEVDHMQPSVAHPDVSNEFPTTERCWILETWNDESDRDVSIARARVEPGITTQLHALDVAERYVIVTGTGKVAVEGLPPTPVVAGDAVVIPAGTPQQITNTSSEDLVFYCVCSPRFRPDGYRSLEEANGD